MALHIDDAALLDRIATILADEADIGTPHHARPDVMITDHWPSPGPAPAILLSDTPDGASAIRAGAAGLLPPDVDAPDLQLAMEAVSRGFVIMPRGAAGSGRDAAPPVPSDPPRDDLLTARELEVLRLLAEGASNKLIARRLGISFHTAKFHVASIAAKLDATGRTDAVAQAVRLGLILL
ncbi:response regulator transcription factor [Microvirga terrae]|uniref:Response regulator transcription factor n=2 Tax=Methylobacteriaceae TaxID=119045 RepID=A0ABY5RV50_9HYPH|nr:response regulator transcription factor [Microvirga terrae]UVF20888.1 response regulator transcription factor [Microvirga terrae]